MLKALARWKRRSTVNDEFSFVAVGYPKVGNTWLRLMLGRYVQQLAQMNEIPLFEPCDAVRLSSAVGPAASGYFTHAPLEWEAQTARDLTRKNTIEPFRKHKIILLVRHPLDAIVSHYMHQKNKLDADSRFHGSISDFAADPVFGLEKFIRFYELWRECKHAVRQCLLWRYEDARKAPDVCLNKILQFLELPLDARAVIDSVSYSSFENMKRMERSARPLIYRSSGFNVFGDGDRGNPDAYHVRSGTVGGFRTELSAESVGKFEEIIGNRLSDFYGY
jgi:hypothetical protein